MSTMKNRVQLVGHLGNDPEVKETQGGRPMARMRVATKERFRMASGEWKEDTQWHQVVAWGKQAEQVGQMLRKGAKVALEGRLVHRDWEDKDGQKRYLTEVVLDHVELMGAKPEPIEVAA